jgi:hypothetical protein
MVKKVFARREIKKGVIGDAELVEAEREGRRGGVREVGPSLGGLDFLESCR